MSGLGKHGKHGGLTFDAALPDDAMADFVRASAARLSVNGRVRLRLTGLSAHTFERLGAQAEGLAAQSDSIPPAMEWLTGNIRWVETVARTLVAAPHTLLPARDGEPRLLKLMRELVAHSDARVNCDRLLRTLTAFDDVQGLSMSELWLAPRALRMALLEGFYSVSSQVVLDQRARLDAERWVAEGAPPIARGRAPGSAFCEHALKLLHELEAPEARRALEQWLEGRAGGSDAMILRAHERQAMNRLLLANIMTTLRALDALNWDICFEKISRADRRLREDPIYPRMDMASRTRVRAQVTLLSNHSGLSEWTVAHHAVRAAGEQPEGDARTTACWWLYDDDGRAELMRRLGVPSTRLARITPDPDGRLYLCAFALTALIALAILLGFVGRWYLVPCLLVLAWRFSGEALGALVTRLRAPRALLRLELPQVPEALRSLVVIPALLSSPERAKELIDQLEAMGALSNDEHLEYLLLGDFRDSDRQEEPQDEDILRAARDGIRSLNERAGRAKYHYLHRKRGYVHRDGRFMGHERKRGALMALNQLLLGGESLFEAEETDATLLQNRFRYVITLDADTRVLPNAFVKLIGAIAHPLNCARVEGERRKGYALLTPRVELSVRGRFAQLLGGMGGVDSYPTSVSSLYQDLCGRGVFGGKGIYELEPFARALEGKLPDGAILSHDLIEGVLSGVGFIGDVTVHDGFPGTLAGYLKRMHRWTRGDWQLVPFIFGRLRLSALDRFLMLDNLFRSLTPASVLLLIMAGLWSDNAPALLVGVLEPFLPLLLSIPHIGEQAVKRAMARLAILPIQAWTQVDAAIRALHRAYVSHKNLLEWTPAADAEKQSDGRLEIIGRVLAILSVPACLRAGWSTAALGIALLFWVGVDWMHALTRDTPKQRLSPDQIATLRDLAERTWLFFSVYVPEDSSGLPPDNVQFDPPVGIARRTSPTNIGLYLTSCLAARELKLIDDAAMLERMTKSISTLESLSKWRGQLYNWYDLDTLQPLPPRYVSTVDGGNLAACLLLCASAVGGALGERMHALAQGMDFASLYDRGNDLFYIGADVERDRVSDSHYDLLASESRILSFVAIALGQVPVKHWFSLGRARTGSALISWSGTLFEYLMPELFLRAPEGSLIAQSNRAVVKLQREAHPDGWGVSESGFFAFDLMMNYQYRAFGLSALSLRGGAFEQVIAPYASMLALSVDAQAAALNLRAMIDRGWMGEFGLYEAIDLDPARLPDGAHSQIVMSHMAHHQGMILASVAGALTGDKLVGYFGRIPEVRALSLLLEEKSTPSVHTRDKARRHADTPARKSTQRLTRAGRVDAKLPDGHLLYGGGATYWVQASGAGFLKVRGVLAGRFRDGLLDGEHDGLYVHVKVDSQYVDMTRRVQFGEGEAQWAGRESLIECRLIQTVSPEDGSLRQHMELKNSADYPRTVEVTGCFAVALCPQNDLRAHPAFQNLFVRSESPAHGTLLFRRNARNGIEQPQLVYAIDAPKGASLTSETDLAKLIGRDGALDRPDTLPETLSGTLGYTLNACAALRARFTLAPGDRQSVTLITCVCDDDEAALVVRGRLMGEFAARSRVLAGTQARAMLDFLSMDAQTHHLLQRASAFLFNPQLRMGEASDEALSIQALWALGVSGDLPIIAVFVRSKEQFPLALASARAHEFYRAMGVWCDLIFVNDYGNDYMQPVRDQLQGMIASCHLRELSGQPGGAYLIEGQTLTGAQRALIRKIGAIVLDGGAGSMAVQLRKMLSPNSKDKPAVRPMRIDHKPERIERNLFNGWGGFLRGGHGYAIDLLPGKPTPAAWCNVLANPDFGALVSERGGGFCWAFNSRLSRITPFAGDPLREGFSEQLSLHESATGRTAMLLPVLPSARCTHEQGASLFESGAEQLKWMLTQFVDSEWSVKCTLISLTNRTPHVRRLTLSASVRFLMGAGVEDARLTEVSASDGLIIARGAMDGAGYLALQGAQADGGALSLPIELGPHQTREYAVLLGYGTSADACATNSNRFFEAGAKARLERTLRHWNDLLSRAKLITPDVMVNEMVNRFLPYQAVAARLYARAGLYQAGGAYGFRDQLQDMLCLLPIAPDMVRRHLVLCASRQFESGDVMHWWHPPTLGVRTRISDDLLFLPYVTACYVHETGDQSILEEDVPYLTDLALPDGAEDIYAEAQVGGVSEPLRCHCMRAIERAARTGAHGLPLIGSGDWNDGMNRVGDEHAGESVWLGEFLAVVARDYARWCAQPGEREGLMQLSERMKTAVEESGWDGRWYRRAYHKDGMVMGSDVNASQHGCRIDLIAQGWAVAAELDAGRTRTAMDEAWERLVDENAGVIKLLTPPFDGEGINPGYIASYPPGVRENGGQYTHGACWGVMGWAGLGQAERAWKAFQMLLPSSHAATAAQASVYRVEPYAVAADVYGEPPHAGRGGWTWYTGAASWLCRVAYTHLMGLDRQGGRARLNALLPSEWDEASVGLSVGKSSYLLTARRDAKAVTLDGRSVDGEYIELVDDGQNHVALFPCRKASD